MGPGEVPPSLCPGGMRSGRKGRRSESSGGRGGPEGAGWKGESSGSCIHVCFASLFSHIIPTLMYPLVSVLTKYVSSSMRSAWASTIMVRVVGAPSGAHLLPPPCCTLLRSSHPPYQIPPLSQKYLNETPVWSLYCGLCSSSQRLTTCSSNNF